jgi:serine/threonine protein kinase
VDVGRELRRASPNPVEDAMIGQQIGPYRVLDKLGEGGMGEVYRATDSQLKRPVAIKVLPAAVAGDADRLMRFQREAEVLAALNHPNIAGIYGVEKTADLTALVMEFVEGEDLSATIARHGPKRGAERAEGPRMEVGPHSQLEEGGLPLSEVLSIARQIAAGLEAAHEQGIIHRDLKPANIKVRPDGTVKILDFGLAKSIEAPRSDATTSPAMTAMGIILGTAAYMSPEQASGRAADKRADIWAFGVVLYEMSTGRRLFEADNVSATLAAVLTRDVNLGSLPDAMPPRLRALIGECLVRDPKQRLRDIGDARIVLDKTIAGASDGAALQYAPSRPAPQRRPLAWIVASAVMLLVAIGLSVPAVRHLGESPPPETRLDIVTPSTTQPSSFALSPDGRQIAFVASDDKVSRLWLRSLSTTAAQPLAGTEGAKYPFWSPDGHSIGFFAQDALKRLDLDGGAPQVVAPAVGGAGGTWNAQGDIVFAPSVAEPLMRVSPTGGAVRPVTTLGAGQTGHYHPQFLPDGRRLLYKSGGSDETRGVYLGSLDGSPPRRLTSLPASGVYAPSGFLLWVQAGSLVAQRLDLERSVLTGLPMTLADRVATDALARSAVSVAGTGLVAYRTATTGNRQFTWFDRSGAVLGVVGEPDGSWTHPRLEPNGHRVAAARMTRDALDIWLLDGGRASRFTVDPDHEALPVWSPDGSRIVYRASSASGGINQKLTSGAGAEEQLLHNGQTIVPDSWSRDGRFLMCTNLDPQTGADLWVLPMTGPAAERRPFVFLRTSFQESAASFSPSGRLVAYESNESGRPQVYVRPFTGVAATPAAGQWMVSTAGGIHPVWGDEGKELYYLSPDGAMMAARITVNGDAVEPGAPMTLFPTRIHGGGVESAQGRQYDVTRDGRFLINTLLNEAAAPITVVQNWNPGAKR